MIKSDNYLFQTGLCKLLEIKDSDIRITTLMQCHDAVDKGIHIGGAFSATIPLVSLFYGGTIKLDIEDPTRRGQDMFVLSKGHTVAAMASIYADLGYFPNSVLKNSRSIDSILKGHPGPILPGVHVSTGPLGQGLSVAEGLALVGKMNPHFDVFCMTGDGELQEGSIWEAIMFSGYKKLDNLCVIVDKNEGQLDDTKQLVVPLVDLDKKCTCFGWRVFNVDGNQYGPVIEALQTFKYAPRDGCPTLIICRTKKGYGGFSNFMRGHKVTITDALLEQEIALHKQRQASRISEFLGYYNELGSKEDGSAIREKLATAAREMNLDMTVTDGKVGEIKPLLVAPKTRRAPSRDKKIQYDTTLLPKLDKAKEYSAASVVTMSMKVFARDPRVVSLDADLGSTSGLEAGVGFLDMSRALNLGVAEANMMGVAEGFAAMGYNTWASTFCPFFDWRVMRRIAIGYQERLEAMEMKDGWLSEGHGLDLTFLATAPNFETKTNGATHMGNDDTQVFGQIAHLKIIDISCPNQLIGAMKWIMEGNKGLVYMRIMRSPSAVIYDNTFKFEFGKAYKLRESTDDRAVIVSSGRGVHEAIAAAIELEQSGIAVGVVDMPSIDEPFLLDLYDSGKLIIVAEQNNGYIWSAYMKTLFKSQRTVDTARVVAINALDSDGQPQFIHSATYSQLLDRFGLSPNRLVETVRQRINPSG